MQLCLWDLVSIQGSNGRGWGKMTNGLHHQAENARVCPFSVQPRAPISTPVASTLSKFLEVLWKCCLNYAMEINSNSQKTTSQFMILPHAASAGQIFRDSQENVLRNSLMCVDHIRGCYWCFLLGHTKGGMQELTLDWVSPQPFRRKSFGLLIPQCYFYYSYKDPNAGRVASIGCHLSGIRV